MYFQSCSYVDFMDESVQDAEDEIHEMHPVAFSHYFGNRQLLHKITPYDGAAG